MISIWCYSCILIDKKRGKKSGTTIIPVKHAQWVAFLQKFVNISLMQCPSYNKDNIVNHVAITEKNIMLESNNCTSAGNVSMCRQNI
jgi:hypothetical protein